MAQTFEPGKAYPIDTLPDDLWDDSVSNAERWSLRTIMLWNDCQGWWTGNAADFVMCRYDAHPIARFWSPCPPSPMTRQEILAERGMTICPTCDVAIDIVGVHKCKRAA